MRTVLEGDSWALTGYVHKYSLPAEAFRQKDVERIFCLEPKPPAVDNLNDYILTSLREKKGIFHLFQWSCLDVLEAIPCRP